MRKLFLLILLAIYVSSCTNDLGTSEVTYTKASAVYGNIEEVRATPMVSSSEAINNPGKIFITENSLFIGEEQKGIHVFDNSDPTDPKPMYFMNIPGNREFFVQDGNIYAESYYDMLKIDITNLNQPRISDRVENYLNSRLIDDNGEAVIGFDFETITRDISNDDYTFWEEFHQDDYVYYDYKNTVIPQSAIPVSFAGSGNNNSGSVNRITKAKDHVYLVHLDKISVFSDVDGFDILETKFEFFGMETIYPQEDKIFIGARQSVLIYDISQPENPQFFSSFQHGEACDPVYPFDEVAYLTLRSGDDDLCPGEENALVALDIREIIFPQSTKTIEMESPYGLSVIGDKLYVGEGTNGMKIFDISDKFQPQLIKTIEGISVFDVITHPTDENMMLLAGPDGFGQFEIEENLDLTEVSWIAY